VPLLRERRPDLFADELSESETASEVQSTMPVVSGFRVLRRLREAMLLARKAFKAG
jgi:hypothetical protein